MKPLILTSCPPLTSIRTTSAISRFIFLSLCMGKVAVADETCRLSWPSDARWWSRQGDHWSDFASRWELSKAKRFRNLSLAEFCQQYETVELWFDTSPEAQLQLIWLLDYFRSYPETVARLKLRLVNRDMIELSPEGFGKWSPPLVDVTEKELATARAAWQAYRATTPEAVSLCLRRFECVAAAEAGLASICSKNCPLPRQGSAPRKCGCWN